MTDALSKMREPFAAHHISKLPKPTKRQTEELKADYRKGQRCELCGGWHQADVIHLDYVGHAALTDRLLDADPNWTWEPLSISPDGLPVLDPHGGMWIRLTVGGVTRLGYGHAGDKEGGDAIKEVIGDALRNAAMRFGAALELWHKGKLHDKQPTSGEGMDALGLFPPHAQRLIRKSSEAAVMAHGQGKEWEAYEEFSTLLNKLGSEDELKRNQVREAFYFIIKDHPNLRSKLKEMSEREYSSKATA